MTVDVLHVNLIIPSFDTHRKEQKKHLQARTWTEGESETARLERLFMIYWFYKKMSWWIFNIIGWLFSHTAATQLCSNSL